MLKHTLYKVIQRKTYTCLSHKYGIYFAYGGLVIILYSMFHFGEEVLEWSRYQYEVAFTVYHDNIVSRSFQHRLCVQLPIDAVYTWVNGSDPDFVAQLKKYKQSYNFNDSNGHLESSCQFSDCFQVPLIIISPKLNQKLLDDVVQSDGYQAEANLFNESKTSNFRFNSLEDARYFSNHFNRSNNYTVSLVHVSTDGSASLSHHLPHVMLLKSLPSNIKTESDLTHNLPTSLQGKVQWLFVSVEHSAAIVQLQDEINVKTLLDGKSNNSIANGIEIGGNLVTLHLTYIVNVYNANNGKEDASKSRFEDNEELRYSLRSVEKYAPWIRHIYIVTNGQIPYWMNMDSPHLTLVTHEEIFVNKSHLPTFSSPAIEAHIHRIPGLSRRFIYLNDDVMFGKEVWPDDFYSQAFGHKVYLTWPVPNCAEGCSPSWITDGYCDAACNVSDCNWDGGDCTGDNIRPGVGVGNNLAGMQWQNSFINYCKPGCSNSWLADKFCDQACNAVECGFDLGDCGLNNYDKLYVFSSNITNDTTHHLPPGRSVGYFKLEETFSKVTKAESEKHECVRGAAVSNKFHVLTIIFNKKCNETKVRLDIRGFPVNKQNDTKEELIQFYIQAFPSKNDSKIIIPIENLEIRATNSTAPQDALPEIIIVNVPDGMKRPLLLKQKANDSSYQLLSIDQFNMTGLPSPVQNRIKEIEREFKSGFLTSAGRQQQIHEVLKSLGRSMEGNQLAGDVKPSPVAHIAKEEAGVQVKIVQTSDNTEDVNKQHRVSKKLNESEIVKLRKLAVYEEDPSSTRKNNYNTSDSFPNGFESLFKKRKLLDTFGDSLRFVSKLYNKRFGFTQRKVPAHMPHMIDVEIMEDLQSKYPLEYDVTSSHRFRHAQDMQFAFSYFYYLMSEEKPVNYSEIFNIFDTDNSAVLSDREIRLMATKLFELPLTLHELTVVEQSLKECAISLYGTSQNTTGRVGIQQPLDGVERWAATETYYDSDMPLVTRHLLLNCPYILDMINKSFSAQKRYKYEEVDQSEIAFKMIRDNVSTVVGQLDDIRRNSKKFICLNDNIDHTAEGSATVRAVLHDFYETLFPQQSQFELSYEYRNRFNTITQLREWKRSHQRTLWVLQAMLVFLFACILVSSYLDRLSRFWRSQKYVWRRKSILKYFSSRKPANPV